MTICRQPWLSKNADILILFLYLLPLFASSSGALSSFSSDPLSPWPATSPPWSAPSPPCPSPCCFRFFLPLLPLPCLPRTWCCGTCMWKKGCEVYNRKVIARCMIHSTCAGRKRKTTLRPLSCIAQYQLDIFIEYRPPFFLMQARSPCRLTYTALTIQAEAETSSLNRCWRGYRSTYKMQNVYC